MRFDFTELLYALSFALDAVEIELTGVKTEHGKRVAYLSCLMGNAFGFTGPELVEFVGCAILHDNAIAEYIREEFNNDYAAAGAAQQEPGMPKIDTKIHCLAGERNCSLLPFRTDVKNIILYHHSTLLEKPAALSQTTFVKSQIVRLADYVDTIGNLTAITEPAFAAIVSHLESLAGLEYPQFVIDLFRNSVHYADLQQMNEKGVENLLRSRVPSEVEDFSDQEVRNIAKTFARIVDYKSSFTKNHSLGVASIADIMATEYHYEPEHQSRFHFAAAFHDIGKLIIPNDILEKPDTLTTEEFVQMKTHAYATYQVLEQIPGLTDIAVLASRHHEKLNGSGYPFGLSEPQLSFDEKLLAVIDIYQALTENRPYKEGFSHEKTMGILYDMVEKGQLDASMVADINRVMGDGGVRKT